MKPHTQTYNFIENIFFHMTVIEVFQKFVKIQLSECYELG